MLNFKKKVTETWNDQGGSGPLLLTLCVISKFYSSGLKIRDYFFRTGILRTRKLGCKILSIGNITVGGTGKTPAAIMVAGLLKENGFRPAVLSRGYGGNAEGKITVVSDGKQVKGKAAESGDEPVLIAQALKNIPVLTGKNRYAAGKYALENLAPDVIILDDGFQHRSLFRDIDIVLLDAGRPFGNGRLLPQGPLREPSNSLARADAVVMTRAAQTSKELEGLLKSIAPMVRIFKACHVPQAVIDHGKGASYPPEFLKGKKIAAFCAIADPASFRRTIEELGGNVLFFRNYLDHHRYSAQDLMDIAKESGPADIILTTEKDGVKIEHGALNNLYLLGIKMVIQDSGFSEWLISRLKK